MAEMIPDRIPNNASAGEKKVFAILQKLPDDVLVYYEPVIGRRYPDFIVVMPSVGLLIIEAKGWYPAYIVDANSSDVTIKIGGRTETQKHPVRQARDYQYGLMDIARLHSRTAALLNTDGSHDGRFSFPFGHVAFLNNCSRSKLDECGLSDVFPADQNVSGDELDVLADLDARQILNTLKGFFDPWFQFKPLSDEQIAALRAIIHPEVNISSKDSVAGEETASLKVLDVRQERNARSIGDGHRVIYGVAGSGKTVILIARAQLFAEYADKRCLILCYNRALAEYFQQTFGAAPNIECMHFHAWGGRNGIRFSAQEDEEVYGERFLEKLTSGTSDLGAFDAVFIDEAQDFAQSWFTCAKFALREPDDGDLIIVGDGSQMLYRRRPFTWADAGIKAQGRTINRRFDLDRNYRNTKEILGLASAFVRVDQEFSDPESSLQVLAPDVEAALRHGPPPEIALAGSVDEECQVVSDRVASWLADGLAPGDIAILYRANTKGWVRKLAAKLSEKFPVNWRQGSHGAFSHPAGVVLTTMHSAKGLQWPGVIITRADTLPFMPDRDGDAAELERLERGLMYVAMTRAEDKLLVTACSKTGFAREVCDLLSC